MVINDTIINMTKDCLRLNFFDLLSINDLFVYLFYIPFHAYEFG